MRDLTKRASRSDGLQSRETILNAAARLATVEGLEGMSIGRLAEYIGMSKSGLYAHFGSKEELQLATVETAEAIYAAEVIEPALQAPEGVPRLSQLCERYLSYVERGVFPGGCFFVSAIAEFDTRPGPVLQAVDEVIVRWFTMFSELVRRAQQAGTLSSNEDPDQLAWELDAFLLMGNMGWVTNKDPQPLRRASAAFRARLALARTAITATAR